jgi:hypothetical protein
MSKITKFLISKEATPFISILLGLGLASMFRASCKSKRCFIIKGPKLKDIENHYYRIDDKCFKYTPYVVNCNEDK